MNEGNADSVAISRFFNCERLDEMQEDGRRPTTIRSANFYDISIEVISYLTTKAQIYDVLSIKCCPNAHHFV